MTDSNTTAEWLTPQFIMLAATLVIQTVVAITILIKFMWKVATKDDIKSLKDDVKSLKADTERDIKSLKTDTEGDIESLKTDTNRNTESLRTEINNNLSEIREDLRGACQNHLKHLNDHANPPFSKHQTPYEGSGPPSVEDFKTRQKGESTADDDNSHTRS